MKNRIRLTDKELGAIHRTICYWQHNPRLGGVIDGKFPTDREIKDWYILRDLSNRSVKDECFCGDECTCGG